MEINSSNLKVDSFITVQGRRFHFIWLRDNCLCPECRHPVSFQKLFDISTYSAKPMPKEFKILDDKLIIDWQELPSHRSIFPIQWLLDNSYDPVPQSVFKPDILWDNEYLKLNSPKVFDINSCNSQDWMEQVSTLGFALLENVSYEKLKNLMSEIGPIHQWECGSFDDVKPSENGMDVAYAPSKPLLPHTDASYRYDPRLIEFLLCIDNQATGGESIIIDGFRVAEDFRQDYPNYFQALSNIPVEFRHYEIELGYFFCRVTPIIEQDSSGKVIGIYFSHKNCERNVAFDYIEDYYSAYSKFFQYLRKPKYCEKFRLRPGNCLIMKNFRILHGRTSYNTNLGSRHLKVGYVGWHYFAGRINFSQYRHLYQS